MENTGDNGCEASDDGRTLKSLERSFAIISELKEREVAGVTELANATGLSKGSVHKHLATLRAGDFVTKDDRAYRLGLRFLDIGADVRNQIEGNTLIQEKLRELAEETGETAQFTVREHGRAVVLYRETGMQGVFSKGRVGKRFHIHHTAAGKAMLAQMPREEVQRLIDTYGLTAATENTITTETALFDELDKVRKQGFAINESESTRGLRAVAVPIVDSDENILGAFAIAGPAHRLKHEQLENEISDLIHRSVNELELNLAHS
ncbi:transcriptional regulator, IclR family [Halogranum rubrum]|uniref:Transcriptional regulator, IclR family n=1 Tax=Halogranum rubrum TaxID=553466 RepID=A0A1I4HTE1_9EURY|nr:IclR family transcriptional regulator [Halogranum rubrum]SFL45415.1 transcriptional regulator, IclR family [Halogranum rubrum]